MGDTKASFASLSWVDWSDVPKDEDNLSRFLKDNFAQAELLANSVPLPPSSNDAQPQSIPSKTAKSAAETFVDSRPTALDARYAELQKVWGKPIKINAKDNPLNVSVYKTAAHDRKGAWFARRSVHSGVSYARWQRAMSKEFLTSLKVKKGPGSGAIRGIAGDQRLDKAQVRGLGAADAWLLSACFPGPVAPRDFVQLIITSDSALTEASAPNDSLDSIPRHWIMISRPLTHDDADVRPGMVRGNYESVELMREIPGTGQDAESNLVEWIMITRSDPGGGIPRFMVDRGTPGGIVGDVPKFIEWAIARDDSQDDMDEDSDAEVEQASEQLPDLAASEPNLHQPTQRVNGPVSRQRSVSEARGQTLQQARMKPEESQYRNSSLFGNLTTAVGSTVGGYLPAYLNPAHYRYEPILEERGRDTRDIDSESTASSSSSGTFASAEEGEDSSSSDSRLEPPVDADGTIVGNDSRPSTANQLMQDDQNARSPHEVELLKLGQKRAALEQKMAKSREDDELRSRGNAQKEEGERTKAAEKADKERKKAEEKYAKEMRQLEERRHKEERKARESREKEEKRDLERQRKAREKDVVLKTTKERDEAREKLKIAEAEKGVLQKQVEELQRENTMLVAKMGAGESGSLEVQKIKREARSRASSSASWRSQKSAKSADKVKSMEKLVGNGA